MGGTASRRKGWFKLPGQDGDRTLEEQSLGLARALDEAKGKLVLDVGCAEGLIALEFARAGASRVVGIELLESHLVVARRLAKDVPDVKFIRADILEWIAAHPVPEQFDIVLALGVCHKVPDPAVPLRWAARSAAGLFLFRGPADSAKGIFRGKHAPHKACDLFAVMKEEKFVEASAIAGTRGEAVRYFRRC